MRLFTLLFLLPLAVCAQSDWEEQRNEAGITIFTRDLEDFAFKEFKAVAILDCQPEEILNLVRDFENAPQWNYKTIRAEVLKKVSPAEYFIYYEIEMPWPLDNRDLIAHLRLTQNKFTKEARIIVESIHDYLPEKEGLVRIKDGQGSYKLNPTPNGKTEVIYRFFSDPSGIPPWIVNLFITDSPFVTLNKMRTEVKKAAYAAKP